MKHPVFISLEECLETLSEEDYRRACAGEVAEKPRRGRPVEMLVGLYKRDKLPPGSQDRPLSGDECAVLGVLGDLPGTTQEEFLSASAIAEITGLTLKRCQRAIASLLVRALGPGRDKDLTKPRFERYGKRGEVWEYDPTWPVYGMKRLLERVPRGMGKYVKISRITPRKETTAERFAWKWIEARAVELGGSYDDYKQAMQEVNARFRKCKGCRYPLPPGVAPQRRYCSESCRKKRR